MRYGEHYDQTFAPVASWTSIRLLLTMVIVNDWKTKQLDYTLAFPQAPVERELYMQIPKGLTINGVNNPNDQLLQIHQNIYGQKQAGQGWFQHLRKRFLSIGFKHDECVFYKDDMMYVLYTDNSIITGPDESKIRETPRQVQQEAGLDITIEGNLTDFLGVNIDRRDDNTIHLTQSKLIKQILDDVRLNNSKVKTKTIPAVSSKLLLRHLDSPSFDNSFHCRSLIGQTQLLGARVKTQDPIHHTPMRSVLVRSKNQTRQCRQMASTLLERDV